MSITRNMLDVGFNRFDDTEKVDTSKIIKELVDTDFSGSNESQGKGIELLKGLAFSDDAMANKFMKQLNSAYSKIGKEVLDGKKEDSKRVGDARNLGKVFNGLNLDTSDSLLVGFELLDIFAGRRENLNVGTEVYTTQGLVKSERKFFGALVSITSGKPHRTDVLMIGEGLYPTPKQAYTEIEKWYYKNRNQVISHSIPKAYSKI